ncbi:hypothetical protein LCEOLIKB_01316 [Aeromonas hydrophila]
MNELMSAKQIALYLAHATTQATTGVRNKP